MPMKNLAIEEELKEKLSEYEAKRRQEEQINLKRA
jgi:hypothetical protein